MTTTIIVGIIVSGLLASGLFILSLKKPLTNPFGAANSSGTHAFFNDIDFAQGDYAVILRHRLDKETLLVNDEKHLIANKDKVQLKTNQLLSLIPGEGGFGEAIYLFKDRHLIKSENPKAFSVFDTGTLAEAGIPVENRTYIGPRKRFLAEQKSLKAQPNIYIYKESELDLEKLDFIFTLHFPSLASNDPAFNTNQIGAELYTRVLEDLQRQHQGFKINYRSASAGSLHPVLLCNAAEKSCPYIYDADNSVLKLDGWTIYHYQLSFSATEEFYAIARQWDFDQYIDKKVWRRAATSFAIAEEVKASGVSINAGSVGFTDFVNEVGLSALEEKQYRLSYFEEKNN